ncbi:GyrI-like domain-containing protein [Mucilaginibacter gotjawali]|uniref:Transcriptional regulator YdeE n=2 Tax=Mucilaginibacter gotjawali TaxID=1550579 RepID=A0A839SFJ5_9SPHI|nr:GyrI-like domain-containing protein [Mucilaginibacter gotjawali]MBB3056063.1 putative transcriptional regulator YdeE [Mucilaginibacter gotjawali]BAU53600.1 Bacterial transcription activator, effector binding domain [Mucilaginibacter gotjawali]
MKTEIIEISQFYLAGITVRTTNQNGQSQIDIGELWGRIMQGNLLAKVENKLSDDTYCVYTDYESDYLGAYTCLIGCKVASPDRIPDGFAGITIAAGKYQVYDPEGKFPEKVHATWQEIWKSDIKRAYTADFDVYGANAKSFEDTEVKIYLAIA